MGGDRTHDKRLKRPLLYRLSYHPIFATSMLFYRIYLILSRVALAQYNFIIHIVILTKLSYNKDNKIQREMKNKKELNRGFTLIELLVVVAIISLLSSIGLIAMQSARQKSRNVKRLANITQMNTALELYFASNRGYPNGVNGVPTALTPQFVNIIPTAPQPADGVCDGLSHNTEVTNNHGGVAVAANEFYYIPEGISFDVGGTQVYPSYSYYFCLGDPTGNFSSGERVLTPAGVR